MSQVVPNASPEGTTLLPRYACGSFCRSTHLYNPLSPLSVFDFIIPLIPCHVIAYTTPNIRCLTPSDPPYSIIPYLPLGLALMQDLMKYDPQQRPTASQTLQYPFFQVNSALPAPEGVEHSKAPGTFTRRPIQVLTHTLSYPQIPSPTLAIHPLTAIRSFPYYCIDLYRRVSRTLEQRNYDLHTLIHPLIRPLTHSYILPLLP